MNTLIRSLVVLAYLGICQAAARAESYPSKPITIVVAYPAGGATDVVARAVGQRLSAALGQPVIIENKGGASTQIGATYVSKAAPDGYTLLATDGTTFINPYLFKRMSYDPTKDFAPVTGLAVINQALVVHPSFPAKNVADLIALAKARPGELNYATLGIGSPSHLNMEMLQSMAAMSLTPVHYQGGAPALTDVLGGHVPMLFLSVTLIAQPWQAGQLRPLAVGSSKRLVRFPELPTVAETMPGFEAAVWFGLFAPRTTPPEIVAKLNAEVQRVLADPEFRDNFLGPNFYEPIAGSPQEFAQYVRSDATKLGKVIQDAKLSMN
jgi:tripartite-type tricarboxylate transporter receptor subunit TctC